MTTEPTPDRLAVAQKLSGLWEPLTTDQRVLLANNISVRHYKKNEIIYQEGDLPQYGMCLLRGKVRIYKNGVGGRQQIVRMVKPTNYFGYRAGFADENYITAAAAFEATTVCLIPLDVVKQLILANNRVAVFFIKQLSSHLGYADERTVSLTQKHIRGRLAESLLALKDEYGVEEDGATLSVYLSREDLANLSNMTTSNAIRTLSSFAAEQLIVLDGRKIKVVDVEKLRKISRIG